MTDEDLQRELACWEAWRGVNGAHYARRMKSSPPVVLKAETQNELRKQVLAYLQTGQRLPAATAADETWPRPPWE